MWTKLSCSQLIQLDRVKPSFLKRVLGLHTSTYNRLVYLLADTELFIEQIKTQFGLPETPAYLEFISSYEEKMAQIDPEFYTTGAMTQSEWKGTGRTNRHIILRFSVHGFHHILCRTDAFHEPCDACVCKCCDLNCARYHGRECRQLTSLTPDWHKPRDRIIL